MINIGAMMGQIDPAQIQRLIQEVKFPISKDELIAKAQQSGIAANLIEKVKSIPQNIFHNQDDLMSQVQKVM